MKKILALSFVLLLVFSCKTTQKATSASPNREFTEDINIVFNRVYFETQLALKNSKFKIDGIDLSFSTTVSNDATAGVKLFVINGQIQRGKTSSKNATFSFEKLDSKDLEVFFNKNISQFAINSNERSLINTSSDYKTAFITYLESIIIEANRIKQNDGFGLKNLEVSVEFTLKKTKLGGVEFDIVPITISGSFEQSKEYTHSIVVKFSPKP
jgi:hypothetical protein